MKRQNRPAPAVVSHVDFRAARQQIEQLDQYSPSLRARALAAYVGLWDLADSQHQVNASSEEIAATFQIRRASWLQYRGILEEAGLVEVDARSGGNRRRFRLEHPRT